jgi:hypothetical protein
MFTFRFLSFCKAHNIVNHTGLLLRASTAVIGHSRNSASFRT